MRLLVLLAGLGLVTSANAQRLLDERFAYTPGTALTSNGWSTHSGTPAQIPVVADGLTFPNYPANGGGAVALKRFRSEDANRMFALQTAGSVYASFLVRFDSLASVGNGSYFFHLGPDTVRTTFRGRVWARDTGAGAGLNLGLSVGGNVPTFGATTLAYGQTYLAVLRYDLVAGELNDAARLYVFASGQPYAAEPATAEVALANDGAADPANIGSVALRQGVSGGSAGVPTTHAGNATIDGIRVSLSYGFATPAEADALAGSPFTLDVRGAREVRFRVREAQAVTVALYDALGRRVAFLFEGAAGAGAEHVVKTPGGLPAGAYFVRLEGETVRATRSLVVR